MSDLKTSAGQPITAEGWNRVVDRLPGEFTGPGLPKMAKLVLVRTTEAIPAANINSADTTLSVYSSGVVNVYGLLNNGNETFSPVLTTESRIMLNPSEQEIPSGTELWGMYTFSGLLVATVWVC